MLYVTMNLTETVDIFRDILKKGDVGPDDDFFACGGDSLEATRVAFRIARITAMPVNDLIKILFSMRTPRRICKSLNEPNNLSGFQAVEKTVITHRKSNPSVLSFTQERFWFLEQIGDVGSTYNETIQFVVNGALSISVLEKSFMELISRHESLRTRIITEDGIALQVVESSVDFHIQIIDLSVLNIAERKDKINVLISAASKQKFSFENGPLLQVILMKLELNKYILLIVAHHIIWDGWSAEILRLELMTLYMAFLRNRTSPLLALSIQYADYAIWQREWLNGEVLQVQLSYWRNRLLGAPPVLLLPTDRPRPSIPSFRGAHVPFSFSKGLSEALLETGRKRGATPFMVLLSIFQILLSRWSGQKDIVVGSAIAGRTQGQTEELIGCFVNMLVFRSNLSDNPKFYKFLDRLRQTATEAYIHQELPFEKVVAELRPKRDLSYQPLFQVVLTLKHVSQDRFELPGLQFLPIEHDRETAKFDLALQLIDRPTGLSGVLTYSTDLFERATAERLVVSFKTLSGSIVADPDRRVSEFPILTDIETHQLLTD